MDEFWLLFGEKVCWCDWVDGCVVVNVGALPFGGHSDVGIPYCIWSVFRLTAICLGFVLAGLVC